MRIHRQIRHLRKPVNPDITRQRIDRSNIELNSERTKEDYLYFDIISRKSTNTFVKQHSTSVNIKPNSDRDDIDHLNSSVKKINFSITQNTDSYIMKDIVPDKIANTTNSNVYDNYAPVVFKNLNSTVFASNNAGKEEVTIHVDDSIPFNNLSVNSGSSITQIKSDVFKINTPGTFKINFILYTTKFSPLGSASIVVDDNPIDTPTTLITAGTPLISHGIFNLKDGDHKVRIVVSGLDLCLSPKKNASIIIEQLN
ncbi:BclA C-terminal domain-containing protein [Clostridium arbusti]|uniref:BclA C-terminal domain-containing protein n=1 Tax=Clostridium arbusti TaxID=1137848 RepID=UPI000289D8B3|nr:hypothetical protein [Clostridium arbusti]